ncbi:glycosyl transferase family 2 [Dyadobacter jejuensis]|uniref:Glycosyl transferase family 2 n=1 Tax=Dyadobacter jejuensis TaxID=1082580 RepID=A0A316ALT9_9BACT|nr:glycosyltransferase [Dyadobacter jejuensis]PWJ58219.1 glycosyl transferase family 2 [Dyadobacter jejuensis]
MQPSTPLVTVVLVSYNRASYLEQAIESVLTQTYACIELIIVDNASSDGSQGLILSYEKQFPSLLCIYNKYNMGLCGAFNQGLKRAGGKYIIDLAADDILLASCIEQQVRCFESLAGDYGLVFSNAYYVDSRGGMIRTHYRIDGQGHAREPIPTGWVYDQVLERYFICTPTMIMRTQMLQDMGGYDESLVVEDFDLWIRTAHRYRYHYLDRILVAKRMLQGSLGMQIVRRGSGILNSHLIVCHKALGFLSTNRQKDLLANRIRGFIRKCWYAQEFSLAQEFGMLLVQLQKPGLFTNLLLLLCRFRLPVNGLYRLYLRIFKKLSA